VIDSTDFDALEESKGEFYKLISNDELKNAIVLIYANKQDVNSAKSVADLIQIYGFDKIKTHQWHIQPCSAKTGEGLMAGLKWLSDQLVYKKNTRFQNNPYLPGIYLYNFRFI
jgi:ADP-ribosylation factor-like protein 5B